MLRYTICTRVRSACTAPVPKLTVAPVLLTSEKVTGAVATVMSALPTNCVVTTGAGVVAGKKPPSDVSIAKVMLISAPAPSVLTHQFT